MLAARLLFFSKVLNARKTNSIPHTHRVVNGRAWVTCAKVPALHRKWLYKMEALTTLFVLLSIIAVVVAILAKAIKMTVSSAWYKKRFAKKQNSWAELTGLVFAPVKRKLFAELDEHLKRLKGDVLEIGIGAGENFHYNPEGTSIVAVDHNPHVEELLRENLKKVCDRVHMKKFVAASAEDMSCTPGKPGVEDNSVAAVVCTLVLCSMTDDQMTKILQEVKRVLMPVSTLYIKLNFL